MKFIKLLAELFLIGFLLKTTVALGLESRLEHEFFNIVLDIVLSGMSFICIVFLVNNSILYSFLKGRKKWL